MLVKSVTSSKTTTFKVENNLQPVGKILKRLKELSHPKFKK